MRITKSLIFSALFTLIIGSVSASTNPGFNSARNEIKDLIVQSHFINSIENELSLNVTFMINAKNEIIIISTDSDEYDATIKDILNYKRLKSADIKVNTTYTLPVAIKK